MQFWEGEESHKNIYEHTHSPPVMTFVSVRLPRVLLGSTTAKMENKKEEKRKKKINASVLWIHPN